MIWKACRSVNFALLDNIVSSHKSQRSQFHLQMQYMQRRTLSSYPRTEVQLEEAITAYKSDIRSLRRWLSFEWVKHSGRVEPVNREIIPKAEAVMRFPPITCINLLEEELIFPPSSAMTKPIPTSSLKLVVFSFKQIGFDYSRRYIEVFEQRVQSSSTKPSHIAIYQINFVEYWFLSFLKSLFVKNLKVLIPESRWKTSYLVFGQVKVSHQQVHP
jgi:hypothetical protein